MFIPEVIQVYYPAAKEWMNVMEASKRSGMSATDIRSRRLKLLAMYDGPINWSALFDVGRPLTGNVVFKGKTLMADCYDQMMAVFNKGFPVARGVKHGRSR